MKTIVSTIVALAVLAGIAAPLSAAEFDSKQFWQQQERSHY
jgi:hypothetical protein